MKLTIEEKYCIIASLFNVYKINLNRYDKGIEKGINNKEVEDYLDLINATIKKIIEA